MSEPIEHDVEQRSPEWFQLRHGIPTASRFSRFITPSTLELSKGKGSEGFAIELAAERIIGGPLDMDDGGDGARERGTAFEAKAVRWYEMIRDTTVRPVGFVTTADGKAGCSPDGLVDDDPEGPGGVEIKNPLTKQHVKNLLGEDPASPTQVFGSLDVTGRKWWDVVSWSEEPALGPVLVRVYPADTIIRKFRAHRAAFEQAIQKAERSLRILGAGGRVDGSDLRAQLVASLEGVEPDPDMMTEDEICQFARDVDAAATAGLLTKDQARGYIDAACAGNWSEARDHWQSVRGALGTVSV